MIRNVLPIAVIIVWLAGCGTLTPKYTRPAAPTPSVWPTGAAYKETKAATVAPTASELTWQEFFTDEKLQQVIGTGLTNNRDLRLAALNVELARALYGIQRDALFPAVNALGSASKQRASADLTQPGQPRTTERYDVNLGVLAWEIDFFGRIRSLKDRALEEYLATEQARRGAQILHFQRLFLLRCRPQPRRRHQQAQFPQVLSEMHQ
jgi:multidrug efflux system outer membrane protein